MAHAAKTAPNETYTLRYSSVPFHLKICQNLCSDFMSWGVTIKNKQTSYYLTVALLIVHAAKTILNETYTIPMHLFLSISKSVKTLLRFLSWEATIKKTSYILTIALLIVHAAKSAPNEAYTIPGTCIVSFPFKNL
jgi:hypothetical protein